MATAGMVSAALEAELQLKVRRHGVVVWLDAEGTYTGLVDRWIGDLQRDVREMRVLAFRGSHLELMLALEPLTSGAEKPSLVVHVPGLSEAQLERSPLLDLACIGTRFRKGLDTLVTEAATGRARPEQIAELLSEKPSLERADSWLAELVAAGMAGIRNQLQAMTLNALCDDLIDNGTLAKRLLDEVDRASIIEQLEAWTGLSRAWRDETLGDGEARAPSLLFSVASFALAVEYVFDLRRPPHDALLTPLTTLARPLRDACRGLAVHLRTRHADLYTRIADQTEAALAIEVEHAVAEDLGKIDTFRFEEDKVLVHALEALEVGDYPKALAAADSRAEASGDIESIWTRRPDRRAAWLVVRDAGRLGGAIDEAPASALAELGRVDELVAAYVLRGAAVDRAHRALEQRRVSALFPEVSYFERLRKCADAMRDVWVAWADGWARAMARVCRERGFLPAPGLMQRTIFEDVVVPLVRDARDAKTGADMPTALFVVDALRYEMGEELFRELEKTPATLATLEARVAELPTLTAVGMNALAPTAIMSGTTPLLRPVIAEGATRIGIEGFTTGSYQVTGRPKRWQAMKDRAGGTGIDMSLEEVVASDVAALKKQVAKARLVIVHSLELDDAGESGVGTMVFDQVLQKLRAAWRLLRDADVRRFVITSDHGFLLLDGLQREPERQGRKTDVERRHVLTRNAAVDPGRVRVGLGELGYSGADGIYLVMSETTNVFDRGARGGGFVHGGNSLQERVIPVLTLIHKGGGGAAAGHYKVHAERKDPVAGMNRISGSVQVEARSQMSLAFAQATHIDLLVQVADGRAGTVEVVQTGDGAELIAAATLRAAVGKSFEVFFRVTGANEERVRIELVPLGPEHQVEPGIVAEWFAAALAVAVAVATVAPSVLAMSWLDAVNSDYRPIYKHLQSHGVISEAEVVAMLGGNPRAARKFARELDGELTKLPFGVRVETTESGKRWVREGA